MSASDAAFEACTKGAQLPELPGTAQLPEKPRTGKRKRARVEAPRSQSTTLIEIGSEAKLFCDMGGDCFIQPQGLIRPVWALESKDSREHLAAEFYQREGKGCNRNSTRDALDTLAAKAKAGRIRQPVWLRSASHEGKVILDTGCDQWRAIEITPDGYKVLPRHPVMFRRSGKMLPYPNFDASPNHNAIFEVLNVAPDDRVLLLTFMLQALRPTGPYPVAVLSGEQGAAKSSAARIMKRFLDPSAVPLRAPPRDEGDLLAAANASRCIAFDNVSSIADWLSDSLCRLATGGGIAARTLFTNLDETLHEVQRPVILNGIDTIPTRGDLADRSLIIELKAVTHRITEAELNRKLDSIAPQVFAGLLAALSKALRALPNTHVENLPRMADFALFACAAEQGLGFKEGEFLRQFERVQKSGALSAIEASPMAEGLIDLIDRRGSFSMSSSKLLLELQGGDNDQSLPRTGKGLVTAIKRLAPSLRKAGFVVRYGDRDQNSVRVITGERIAKIPNVPASEPGTSGTSGTSGRCFDSTHAGVPIAPSVALVEGEL